MRNTVLSLLSILPLFLIALCMILKGSLLLFKIKKMNDSEEKSQNLFSAIGLILFGVGGLIVLTYAVFFMY